MLCLSLDSVEGKECAISSPVPKTKEPKPRLGEILVYEPDRAQGILYSLREGRILPFKLADSPGLPGDILKPGIQVHFIAVTDDAGGYKAVNLSFEPVASLDARLRYVAKRAANRSRSASEVVTAGTTSTSAASWSVGDDIAFMEAGVSEALTRGRRGSAGGRREREKPTEAEETKDLQADSDSDSAKSADSRSGASSQPTQEEVAPDETGRVTDADTNSTSGAS